MWRQSCLPAVKLIKQQTPDAEVDVLTFGAGIELMQMMPEVHAVLGVSQEQWPGELIPSGAELCRDR